MLVLLFVALWFILRYDLFYVLSFVILFLCFSVLLALRSPRLGKRELILMHFVRLFDLCLLGFVGFLFLLVSEKGCGLWLWHSLDFSLTYFLVVFRLGISSRVSSVIAAIPGYLQYNFYHVLRYLHMTQGHISQWHVSNIHKHVINSGKKGKGKV